MVVKKEKRQVGYHKFGSKKKYVPKMVDPTMILEMIGAF